LPPARRAVLDRAAVEGRSFHRSAIAELLEPSDRRVLDASLDALARRQLIRPGPGDLPGEAGYHFSHILVRDVAYELLPKSERAALHERYAAWLDRRAGARYAELVGYHFEQAHRLHEELRPRAEDERRMLASAAVERLGQAGRAALERGDLPGGINLLERTAALIEPGDPRGGEVLPELGLALVNVGNLSHAETVLVDAAQAASAAGAPLAEAHARVAQFFALIQLDPEVAAHELSLRFDVLRDTFTAAADDRGLARLWGGQALIHWLAGATQRAAAAWDRSLRYAVRAGDQTARADALVWQASAARVGPLPVPRAIAQCEAILRQLDADRRSQAQVMRSVACLRAMAGDFDAAGQLFDRSTAIHAELGVSMHAAVSQEEGFVQMVAGEPAKAEAVLRYGCEQLEQMGERALLSTTAGMLAQALIELGRFDEALSHSEVAEEMAAPDDLSSNILYRTTRAQVLAHQEEFDVADRLSLEAVELGDGTDCLVDRGDAHMARGRVLRAQGRMNDAAVEFLRARDLYALKGSVVSCHRAEAALDAAGAPTLPR
jgi:predicted ATPase